MNIKNIVTIVGIIMLMAILVSSDDGMLCVEQVVCDQDGFEYPTQCDFNDAREDNPTLEIAPCPIERS